jgi:uncharacterized repeat protein (TIGR04076 family)
MNSKQSMLQIRDLWKEPVRYQVTVVKEGYCRANHKEGESFDFMWNTPAGLCAESFVGMYPILHSLRTHGDMRELGDSTRSPVRNVRIYTCPSRVIQFRIEAHYRCSLCEATLPIKDNEISAHYLVNPKANIRIQVCQECHTTYQDREIIW